MPPPERLPLPEWDGYINRFPKETEKIPYSHPLDYSVRFYFLRSSFLPLFTGHTTPFITDFLHYTEKDNFFTIWYLSKFHFHFVILL